MAIPIVVPFVCAIFGQALTRVLDSFKRDEILEKDYGKHISSLECNIYKIERCMNTIVLDDEVILNWYAELKDAMYAAVDTLDIYLATEKRLTDKHMRKKLDAIMNFIYTTTNHSLSWDNTRPILRAVEMINDKIEKLLEEKRNDEWLKTIESKLKDYPKMVLVPTSLPDDDSIVLGRDAIKSYIMTKLNGDYMGGSNVNLRILAVVGTGGIGKTALVRSVYASGMQQFQLRGWVHDSSEVFDVKSVLTAILIRFGMEQSRITSEDHENLTTSLANMVSEKKFCLILDDTWTIVESRWQELLRPLNRGKAGSWLIVTTRDKCVVEAIYKSNIGHVEPEIQLSGLSKKFLWEILKQQAFKEHPSEAHQEFVPIGKGIVDKLDGSPSAAKAIGRVLAADLSKVHWENVRDSGLWDSLVSKEDKNLIPALVQSFLHLSSHAKPCFTYCSLFPKDEAIDEQQLVYQWLSHGYLRVQDEESVEDAGISVLKYIQNMSLFTRWSYQSGYTPGLEMDGLIHDTSRASGRDDHLQILDYSELDRLVQQKKLRHLSIYTKEELSDKSLLKLTNNKRLRTLIFISQLKMKMENPTFLTKWFTEFKCLRVLTLNGLGIEELPPKETRKLKCLRYLDLSCNPIRSLPDTLVKLHHLQALILRDCSSVNLRILSKRLGSLPKLQYFDLSGNTQMEELPEAATVLSNLRVLRLQRCSRLKKLPEKIGQLKRLECLDLHSCIKLRSLPDDLTLLSHLRELELRFCPNLGTLPKTIINLKKLRRLFLNQSLRSNISGIGKLNLLETLDEFSVQEKDGHRIDELANLNMLRGRLKIGNLEVVKFRKEAENAGMDKKIFLKELILHWNLRDRTIKDVKNEEVLECLKPYKHLTELSIHNYIGILPSWLDNQHLPCLKRLSLYGLHLYLAPSENMSEDNSKTFQFVEEINFENLHNLSHLKGVDNTLEGVDRRGRMVFPSLRKITVSNCKELESMLDMPPSLENIYLRTCTKLVNLTFLNTKQESPQIRLPPHLCELVIIKCPGLEKESWLKSPSQALTSVQNLQLEHCCSHVSSQSETSDTCPDFQPFLKLTSMKRLAIRNCKNLYSIPAGMSSLSSLETLEIMYCDNFSMRESQVSAFHQLKSVKLLKLYNCNNLQGSSTIESFPGLQNLFISCCINLVPPDADFIVSVNLKSLILINCSGISKLPRKYNSNHPSHHSVSELTIKECRGLSIDVIRDNIAAFTSLQRLIIMNCELPRDTVFVTPAHLQRLILINCSGLSDLQVKDTANQSMLCSLSVLTIKDCKDLPIEVIWKFVKPQTSLQRLVIRNCGGSLSNSIVRELLIFVLPAPNEPPHPENVSCREISSADFSLCYHNASVRIEDIKIQEDGEEVTNGMASINWMKANNEDTCTRQQILTEMLKRIGKYCIKKIIIAGVCGLKACENKLLEPQKNRKRSFSDRSLPDDIGYSSSLETLEIWDCDGILDEGVLSNPLPRLCRILIKDCANLLEIRLTKCVSRSTILKSLTLDNCHMFPKISLPDGLSFPPSLEELIIRGCIFNEIDSIEKPMQAPFNSVQRLMLSNCKGHLPNSFVKKMLSLPNLSSCEICSDDQVFKIYWSLYIAGIEWGCELVGDEGERVNEPTAEDNDCSRKELLKEMLGRISSLRITKLNITGLPNLTNMGEFDRLFGSLIHLEELIISCCMNLCPLSKGICGHEGLKKLTVKHCPQELHGNRPLSLCSSINYEFDTNH